MPFGNESIYAASLAMTFAAPSIGTKSRV